MAEVASVGRKKNFTIEEKNVFLNLLKREKSIWEYKTEGCTESSKKLKSEAWTRVCKKFNSFEGFTKRDIKQLRKLWDNMKTERKKEQAALKKAAVKTGGDLVEKSVDEDPTIHVLLDCAVDVEHRNTIDSDTVCLAMGTTVSASTLTPLLDISTLDSIMSIEKEKCTALNGSTTVMSNTLKTNTESIEDCIEEDIEDPYEDNADPLTSTVTSKSRKKEDSSFEEICNLHKKYMLAEHTLRVKVLNEEHAAAKAKKDYYLNKSKQNRT